MADTSERRGLACPLCGRPNLCRVAESGSADAVQSCWCAVVEIVPASLAALPEGSDASCLCADCARGDYPSPCQQVCVLDARRERCATCLRTLDEIRDWGVRSPDEKLRLLAELARRRLAR